jgi:hypothetical protein
LLLGYGVNFPSIHAACVAKFNLWQVAMKCVWALELLVAVLALTVTAQDYAEYARGAGMARRRNNRCDAHINMNSMHFFLILFCS